MPTATAATQAVAEDALAPAEPTNAIADDEAEPVEPAADASEENKEPTQVEAVEAVIDGPVADVATDEPAPAEPTEVAIGESVPAEPLADAIEKTEPVAEATAAVADESVPAERVADVTEAVTDETAPAEPVAEATAAVTDETAPAEPAVDATEEPAPVGSLRDGRRFGEPAVPDDIQFSDLDPEARRELRSLTKSTAELVGRHLVAAGRLIDDDPELALEHARFARSRAARVAVVREAAGLAAYHVGEWAEALGELRAVRRMSGGQSHLPVMADCERALGRPERALELAAEARDLPKDVAVELRIVTAGARRDMGQLDAAVVALQGPDLDPKIREPWTPRLFYAYADNLEAAGRTEDAIRWFLNAAEADLDEETDAAERAFELRDHE